MRQLRRLLLGIERHPATARLLAAAAGTWTAALLGSIWWLLPLGACSLLAAYEVLIREGLPRRRRVVMSAVLFAALGGCLAVGSGHIPRSVPEEIETDAVVVTDPVSTDSGGQKARISTGYGGMTVLSSDPVPAAGSRIIITAHVERRGSELTAFAERTEETAPPGALWEFRGRLRSHLRDLAGDRHPGALLLPGLTVGDTSQLPAEVVDDMKAVSLTHLTAVSGSNISLVALSIITAVRALTRARFAALAAAFAGSAAYVFIVGPDPSVIRAAGMGLIGIIVMARGTGRAAVGILATTVAVLLIIRPDLSSSVGFVLSVAATGALIVLSRPVTLQLQRWKVPRILAQLTAVPVCAQLGVLPVMVSLGSPPGAWSVLVNMLAAPVVGPATILGLLAMASLPLSVVPGVTEFAAFAAAAGAWGARWITVLAAVGADLPGTNLPWLTGAAGTLLALSASICFGIAAVTERHRRVLSAVAGLVCVSVGALSPLIILPTAGHWWLAVCDVGQGSAAAVRLGDGGHIGLIDTGDDRERLDRCLTAVRAERVTLFISHFDRDHVGAVSAVTEHGRTVDSWFVPEGHDDVREEAIAQTLGSQPHRLSQGATLLAGHTRVNVLWPPVGRSLGSNEGSLVLRISSPHGTVLLPGDIGADQQSELARTVEPVDILVAPHHGSNDIDVRFFQRASARIGLISVGDNSYGHPTQDAIRAFGQAPVLRTDTCGTLVAHTDGSLAGAGRTCAIVG